MTVSYTHLDVYKRQLLRSERLTGYEKAKPAEMPEIIMWG